MICLCSSNLSGNLCPSDALFVQAEVKGKRQRRMTKSPAVLGQQAPRACRQQGQHQASEATAEDEEEEVTEFRASSAAEKPFAARQQHKQQQQQQQPPVKLLRESRARYLKAKKAKKQQKQQRAAAWALQHAAAAVNQPAFGEQAEAPLKVHSAHARTCRKASSSY